MSFEHEDERRLLDVIETSASGQMFAGLGPIIALEAGCIN